MFLESFPRRCAGAVVSLAAVAIAACTRSGPAPGKESPAPSSAPGLAVTPDAAGDAAPAGSLVIASRAFAHQGAIPRKYTCEGEDVSLPLTITGAPPGTKSIALVMDDPDAPDPAAPQRVWVHWVAYDLPADTSEIPEGAGNHPGLGRLGKNDWHATGYRGPCPPVGRHRFFVRAFALDRELGDLQEPNKGALLRAMAGHVLASGERVGTYQKGG